MDSQAGLDIKSISDWAAVNWRVLALFIGLPLLVWLFLSTRFAKRLGNVIQEMMFSNWRLALLGLTALVLSFASGYTTWDGMSNFTGEPVLSGMITFGIQGVELITAWLIGESFATGMNVVPGQQKNTRFAAMSVAVGLFSLVLLAVAAGLYAATSQISGQTVIYALAAAGAALFALTVIAVFSKSDIVAPYVQAVRLIAKNSMLWVMFLATMAMSVFFSFDSRFTAVFPQEERVRVSELRAQNQVAGILADIGQTIDRRRLEEAEKLFGAEGWKAYETHLDKLASQSQGSAGEIERFFVQQMEERRTGIAQQQERIATAEGSKAGLAAKKTALTDELSRISAERPGLAAEYAQHKSELDAKAKDVDAKRIEALAEDKGVEGTGKVGRGPMYRERMAELGKLQAEYKVKEERTKAAQKRFGDVEARMTQIQRELAAIDGDLAKLTGESDTAAKRIEASQTTLSGDDVLRVDPSRVLPAFEKAKVEFRQEPTVEKLAVLHEQCTQLQGAMIATPATKEKVRGIDCDPKQASEASALVFTLNAGTKSFAANCSGGDKLAQYKGTDALFAFAVKCLGDSGLPSKDTDELRSKISFAELNRDDKAHRFVVTWNAFQDGNRLAYLALAIAIAIDSLIFMSGLFGANAVRSPLSDVPSLKARNADQLEAIIENALLPDRYENASLVIEAMTPISPHDGFTAEVIVPPHESPSKNRILKVLNAGASFGAVERDPHQRDRFLVRAELFEFLSIVAKREFEADDSHNKINELEKIIYVALLPAVDRAVDAVLKHLHPINEKNGFTSEIFVSEVERDMPEQVRTVRSVLNAGSTLHVVQRCHQDPKITDRYYIHGDLYKTLARIRARMLASGPSQQLLGASRGVRDGGVLRDQTRALPRAETKALPPAERRIAQQPAEYEPERYEAHRELLNSMGLDAETYDALIEARALNSASVAADQLSRLARSHPRLGARYNEDYRRLSDALDRSYKMAKLDKRGATSVDAAYRDLHDILPALMLLGGYYQAGIAEMIGDMERAAAEDQLSRTDKAFLRQLQGHASSLNSIPLGTAAGLEEAGRLLSDFDEEVITMAIRRRDAGTGA